MTSHLLRGAALSVTTLLALSLTACAADVRAGGVTEASDSPSPTSAKPTPTKRSTPTPSPTEAKETLSTRGNLLSEVGETAVIHTIVDEETLVEFTVNSIKVDPKCTAPRADKPENGHFLVLDVDVETQQGMEDVLYDDFQMNPYDFKMIDEDGKTSNVDFNTVAVFSCFPDSELLPDEIGDSETASGKVVLDTDVKSGTLVFEMDELGWEWEY
jgi:hypothetical protein